MKRKTFTIVLYAILIGLIFLVLMIVFCLATQQKTIFGATPTTDTALMLFVFIAVTKTAINQVKTKKTK